MLDKEVSIEGLVTDVSKSQNGEKFFGVDGSNWKN
jgi:hypothetical protein